MWICLAEKAKESATYRGACASSWGKYIIFALKLYQAGLSVEYGLNQALSPVDQFEGEKGRLPF